MCRTVLYHHPTCGCRWLEVARPCGINMGLSTCPTFLDPGVVRPGPLCAACPHGRPCPRHELRGAYDRNVMRMVLAIENGIKIGRGPARGDPGVEIRLGSCAVM